MLASIVLTLCSLTATAQEPDIPRPGPPRLEDFETDADKDGIPDGWYNLRDARIATGGVVGPACIRFETTKPGRPARLSRAFGMNAKETEAVIIGLWVRQENVLAGERLAEDPGLMIDFLGDQLRATGRGSLGPWTKSVGASWVRVSKRIPVPVGTHDAILSIGLFGASGILDVDGLTIDLVPAGGPPATDLILNGNFELGDVDPPHWLLEGGARRVYPGHDSDSALELTRSGAKALNGLSVPVEKLQSLEVRLNARGTGLRGSGGAAGEIFFLDGDGRPLPGSKSGVRVFRWAGSFDWKAQTSTVAVPGGAVRAVLQIEKLDAQGTLRVDDAQIFARPDPEAAAWTPYHVEDETEGWAPLPASPKIEPGSALDLSGLLLAPAGRLGRVIVKGGRFHFEKGPRARFVGVSLLPPLAYLDHDRADALADRLARSGVNLVRLTDLDMPLGPGLSLYDDARDDTRALDPVALEKLEHLIASLKKRGVYIALELDGSRRFREGDGIPEVRRLPLGGGPAVGFEPTVRQRLIEEAKLLLGHLNPETGLALKDDPVLAFVTLVGENSLFDLLDDPGALPPRLLESLRNAAQRTGQGSGRRGWSALESASWKAEVEALRSFGLKAPVAGGCHWRREAEYSAVQAAAGLDFVDDRLYWSPPRWGDPDYRSMLWDPAGNLAGPAGKKRRTDRPYVVGQWADHTEGMWAQPYEAADVMLGLRTALREDWDALVRRGIYRHPEAWGAAAPGTSGGDDIHSPPEALNANPGVFAMLPHMASALLRAESADTKTGGKSADALARGRLVLDTPHTQALAGWSKGQPAVFDSLTIATESPYAVVAVSSTDAEPISRAHRLLVTVLARAEPTGIAWDDAWKRRVASPGRPPLLLEPAIASILWKRKGAVHAYALDSTGKRLETIATEAMAAGVRLKTGGPPGTIHWELVVDDGR